MMKGFTKTRNTLSEEGRMNRDTTALRKYGL